VGSRSTDVSRGSEGGEGAKRREARRCGSCVQRSGKAMETLFPAISALLLWRQRELLSLKDSINSAFLQPSRVFQLDEVLVEGFQLAGDRRQHKRHLIVPFEQRKCRTRPDTGPNCAPIPILAVSWPIPLPLRMNSRLPGAIAARHFPLLANWLWWAVLFKVSVRKSIRRRNRVIPTFTTRVAKVDLIAMHAALEAKCLVLAILANADS
jgi:hypothetical protein